MKETDDYDRLEGRAVRTCKEMLTARGYSFVDIEGPHVISAVDTRHELVYVYVDRNPKLNMEVIRYYYSLVLGDGVSHMVIIYRNIVTSSVYKIMKALSVKYELFALSELQFNITKHTLVPRHIRVDNATKNNNKLPIIKRSDPVSKFYDFQPGDIIEIHRHNKSIYYRYVK